jgi:FixJ family two-component response regulator
LPAMIHIVDDDESFRTSTGRLLRACGYDVALYSSGEQLLAQLPKRGGPSCILLDVKIPGLTGPELQARLTALGSILPIVFLTGHGDIPTTVQVIKAGAEDLLTKPVSRDQLINAIERALARAHAAQAEHDQVDALLKRVSGLTPRERQVFERVARGVLNKQIAHELGTTERTIKAHRRNVMEKIQAKSVAELVMVAERLGVLRTAANGEQVPHKGPRAT